MFRTSGVSPSDADSQLTLDKQLQAAQQEYNRLLAEINASDYSEIDKLDSAAEQFISLFGQVYGTSTQGFESQRQAILEQLRQILALGDIPTTTAASNVLQMPLQDTRDNTAENVLATREVATNIVRMSTVQAKKLDAVVDSVADLSTSIRELTASGKLSYG